MRTTDTIVIGGGQAGLAMSARLAEAGIDHVVLERGRVAERWRSARCDSLRLLTPNWQSRLPGWSYRGSDPDGYMTRDELIAHLAGYADAVRAPVETDTRVLAVTPAEGGYRVATDRGEWRAPNVVIATGYCDRPFVPCPAEALSPDIAQVVPSAYRGPDRLPAGGVLVVGASSTGIQLADEIRAAGRDVVLSVGRHIRLPRTYRGSDILAWFDAMGVFDETVNDVADIDASRRQPSLQLVGRPDRRSLDLGTLRARGVRLAGRLIGVDRRRAWFADDLADNVAAAESKLRRLLERVDRFVERSGFAGRVPPPEAIPRIDVDAAPGALDLAAEGIGTVVWATGFRRSYPWLAVPVLDERGEIRHDGGVTPSPGLFVLGMHFQRRRKSAFLDGVGADAADLTAIVRARLGHARAVA